MRWKRFNAFLSGLTFGILVALNVAFGAAPTIGNTGACTLATSILTCTVTTTGTNKIVVFSPATTTTTATPTTVSTITDAGAAGLTFTKRGASASVDSTCVAGTQAHCSLDVEEWWTLAATALTSEVIHINLSTTPTQGGGGWAEIAGAFSTSVPFDGNVSLPATAHGVTSVPTVTGISTSSTDDRIIALAVEGRNSSPGSPCFLTFAAWTSDLGNITASNSFYLHGLTQGTTVLLATQTAKFSTLSGNCPAGESTASGDNWAVLMDAMNGNAASAAACPGYKALKGVGC